ncbi:MAG: polysaccharide deacetylase family protein [Treponemataceae bacterium]
MKKTVTILFCLIFAIVDIFSQVRFNDFDLNNNNKLLFSVEHTPVVESKYQGLFYYSVDEPVQQADYFGENSNPRLLTCYPEEIEVTHGGKFFLIRNRYGSAQYNTETKSLSWVSKSKELEKDYENFIPVNHERFIPLSVSPDGNFLCFIEQTSAARGKLLVKSLINNQTFVLSSQIHYGYEDLPVIWSPNSTVLVYENRGTLYFLNLKDGSFSKQLPEKYRKIGNGTIRNVYWAGEKKLIYVDHELVYAISSDELYTRALYSDLIGNGKIIGRIPTIFNSAQDKFWTSEDGLNFVLLQGNRTLWYMELTGTDFNFATTLFSYPFVTVPGTALNFKVFWTQQRKGGIPQIPLVWLEMLRDGKSESYLYSLEKSKEGNNAYFVSLPVPTFAKKPRLSPDKKHLAFICDKAFYVYDITSWVQKYVFNDEELTSFAWIGRDKLVLGGKYTVRLWKCNSDISEIIFLSQAKNFGWDGESDTVIEKNDFGFFKYQAKSGTWIKSDTNIIRDRSTRNGKWRIFIDDSPNPAFENTLYCRELNSESYNRVIFDSTVKKSTYEKPVVALTFDCLDNADGLTPILCSLARYGIKATFFINGEFVRRFPTGVNEIIKAGHQCGSMFYSAYTVSSDDFNFNENYIRRGLARNEDDFFELTGHELSLFWHMPDYYSNDIIQKSGNKAGYVWIDKGLAPPDRVTYEDTIRKISKYNTTSQMIDDVIENLKPGSVIPVSVGLSYGTRGDFLYDNLDVLISAILSKGYKIVTVSELLQDK